jgi:hypothetical protein
MTANTTFSSLDDSTQTAALYLSDSFMESEEFGMIDSLDYEDLDDGLIGKPLPKKKKLTCRSKCVRIHI